MRKKEKKDKLSSSSQRKSSDTHMRVSGAALTSPGMG
jgi:hypothetical protein